MSDTGKGTWFGTFSQQFKALFRKNVLLAWRNRRATTLRLVAPFLFMLLVWLIDRAIQAEDRSLSQFKVVRDPEAEAVDPIPRCEEDLYIQDTKCYDFYWTADTPVLNSTEAALQAANDTAAEIVRGIRVHNDPPIPEDKVRWFPDRVATDEHFLANPETCLAAVHFYVSEDLKQIDFTLQTNSTPKFFKGDFQHPNFFVQVPLQNAVEREIARFHLRTAGRVEDAENLKWNVAYREYPHPAFDTVSIVASTLGPFLFAANMFGFVSQIGAIVKEKEQGMRQALRTMGMLDSTYWLSWAAWELIMVTVTTLLIIIFGLFFQFKFFTDNSFGLLFFLFFLFQMAMSGMGFLITVFINRAVGSTLTGFVLFLLGWITQTVIQFEIPYSSEYFKSLWYVTVIFTMMPWNLFMKGVLDLGKATSNKETDGLSWSERNSYCKDEDGSVACEVKATQTDNYIDCECVMPLGDIFGILCLLYIGYFILGVYLEKVLPNENGVRLPPWYFLQKRYWGFTNGWQTSKETLQILANDGAGSQDDDVAAEENKMKEKLGTASNVAASGSFELNGDAVQLFSLQKVFGRGDKKFWALKGSWFSIEKNQLFCLLGPNGAGKTTTINCLTGVIPASGGDALIYGESIKAPGGLDRIRSIMGVCPQFDVLWGELTGKEHLEVFGHVKGLPASNVRDEAAALLEKVKLTPAASQMSGSYSGGMKRRLSVAISLLGDPKIVYLDEPTTGMDPISRRYVWDIIESAKAGRAIILTTHSMEEADILGDRIGIMARGRMRGIGTSIRLKQKFGAGYEVSVSVSPPRGSSQTSLADYSQHVSDVKALFKSSLGLEPRDENRAYITYLIPRDCEERLPKFLADLESSRERMHITDIQLSLTTLEEVFLSIARQAEIEALQQSGVTHMSIPFTDGTNVVVPLGDATFEHPGSNVTYEVRWGQDESGSLTLLDCVPTGDVPENVPEPDLSMVKL